MEFRLTYSGLLRTNASVQDKMYLRRCFHAQLVELWNQVPLRDFRDLLNPAPASGQISIIQPLGPFQFAPLVTQRIHLVCELEITLLRPEPPGSVITQSGDIDNRLKTLFDGLRMPRHLAELVPSDSPKSNETPFFCLLEDDNLVTKVAVVTDRLLARVPNAGHVLLLIRVTTSATKMIYKNMGLA